MGEQTQSLSSLFKAGSDIYENVQHYSLPTNTKQCQDEIKKGIQTLEQATIMVSELSLFSSNEILEEIATSDLRYLMLPALLGSLTSKISDRDRLEVLETAEIYFIDFLKRLKSYGFSNAKIPQVNEDETICPDKIPQRAMTSLQSLEKAAMDRNAKIQRFQKQKELKQRQDELQKRIDAEELDEERVREFYTVSLDAWAITTMEELESIQKEKPLVRLMSEMKESGKPKEDRRPIQKPLKPIIIARNELQKQVLGIGYPSRPILTVDEFYAQRYPDHKKDETPMGMSMQKWAEDPDRAKDELDEEAQEKEEKEEREDKDELRRAREWDDWKDDHRRGWGNRKNMG